MMDGWKTRLIVSASLLCLAGGCATGQRASLDIRSRNDVQAPPTGERSIEHGKVLLNRGQYADAISAFRTALREEEGSAEAHNGLAIAYDAIGRKDLARRYFELAVAERPEEIRYRNNLARFFDNSGHPELAEGLRDTPAVMAKAEPAPVDDPVVQLASATLEPFAAENTVDDSDETDTLVATIMAGLSDGMIGQKQFADVGHSAILPTVSELSDNQRFQSNKAVFRSTATPAIKAASIQLPNRRGPDRDPLDHRFTLVADLPRSERRQSLAQSPYIERVSLGEVNLVTRPTLPGNIVVAERDPFADQLALWAEDEKRSLEYQRGAGLKGRLAIRHAVERAAAEEAKAASVASLAALAEKIDRDFVYLFYDEVHPGAQEADA